MSQNLGAEGAEAEGDPSMSKLSQDLGTEGAEAEACCDKIATENALLQVATTTPADPVMLEHLPIKRYNLSHQLPSVVILVIRLTHRLLSPRVLQHRSHFLCFRSVVRRSMEILKENCWKTWKAWTWP